MSRNSSIYSCVLSDVGNNLFSYFLNIPVSSRKFLKLMKFYFTSALATNIFFLSKIRKDFCCNIQKPNLLHFSEISQYIYKDLTKFN